MNENTVYLVGLLLLLASGLVILRLIVRRSYLRRGRLSWAVAALQAALWFAYGGFPVLYLPADWPALHVGGIQQAVGFILIVAGLANLLYGMGRLGIARSLGRGKPGLEQAGLYRFTRNPQALACGLYVLGFVMLWPSGYAVGWALLYVALIHAMILTEEEHLRHCQGEAYEAYCRDVPRYAGR